MASNASMSAFTNEYNGIPSAMNDTLYKPH